MLRAPSAALCAALLAPLPAAAMEFEVQTGEQGTIVHARGPIQPGDAARLRSLAAGAPGVVLLIDSPGGQLAEGARLAQVVAAERMPVAVGGMCASACFLPFAASPLRMAFPQSRVGVHSVYHRDDGETPATMALTTAMARAASSYGVPPSIIGRMVTTSGRGMAWLDDAEMRAMRVRILPGGTAPQQQSAPRFAETPPRSPSPRVAAARPGIAQEPPSRRLPPVAGPPHEAGPKFSGAVEPSGYERGREDRLSHHRWFAGLTDAGRAGAAHWAERHRLGQPGNCVNRDPAFAIACFEAQRRLARADAQLSRDPDYRRGWGGS